MQNLTIIISKYLTRFIVVSRINPCRHPHKYSEYFLYFTGNKTLKSTKWLLPLHIFITHHSAVLPRQTKASVELWLLKWTVGFDFIAHYVTAYYADNLHDNLWQIMALTYKVEGKILYKFKRIMSRIPQAELLLYGCMRLSSQIRIHHVLNLDVVDSNVKHVNADFSCICTNLQFLAF